MWLLLLTPYSHWLNCLSPAPSPTSSIFTRSWLSCVSSLFTSLVWSTWSGRQRESSITREYALIYICPDLICVTEICICESQWNLCNLNTLVKRLFFSISWLGASPIGRFPYIWRVVWLIIIKGVAGSVPIMLAFYKYSFYTCFIYLAFRSENIDLEKEFEQNELNSAVYLISIAMQISNFAVNYKVSLGCLKCKC